MRRCCLATVALAATAPMVHSLCLPNGTQPANRVNITINGKSMPLGVISYTWTSTLIEAAVYRILVEEVLGFHTDIVRFVASVEGFFMISGCPCALTGGCYGTVFGCEQAIDRWHILLGAWLSYDVAGRRYVSANFPDQFPTDLGNLGYPAWDHMCISQDVVVEAFAEEETPLEYYRGYNTSTNLTQFFSSVPDIPKERLRLCNESRFTFSSEMSTYARVTGDWDGIVSDGSGAYQGRCGYEGRWWLTPRCRHDVRACVPLITGGEGWNLVQWMIKATSYNMPVAIAVTNGWNEYTTVPYDFRVLVYWWYPDSTFTRLRAGPITFPRHNAEEWAQGNLRTFAKDEELKKLAWHGLGQVAGERFSELARRFSFTEQAANRLTNAFVKLESQRPSMALEDMGYEVACEWLQENEEIWRSWVPSLTECEAGQGLVGAGAALGDFVFNRAEASSCQWCATGRYSVPVADAEGETRVCLPCPAGTDQSYSGQTSCLPCAPGRFKAGSSAELCDRCYPGTATALQGQTACPLCARGSATARRGELHCVACINGTEAQEEGQFTCSFCAQGRFSDSEGASACTPCGLALEGSTSPRGSVAETECSCPVGKYMALDKACLPCPSGLHCPGGNGEPLQQAGSWVDLSVPEASLQRRYGPHTFRCRDKDECPAGPLGGCAAHRQGTACNNCEAWHYPNEGGHCSPCGSMGPLPFISLVVVLPVGLFALLLLTHSDACSQHLSLVTVACVTGQVVTSMQTLSAVHRAQIRFPPPLRGLLEVLGSWMNFDVLNLPCVVPSDTPVTYFIVQLLAYPTLALLLLLLAGLLRLAGRSIDVAVLHNTNGMLVFLAYISMTLNVLLPFQCDETPGGFDTMVTEPGLKCYADADHIALAILGFIGILAYPVTIAAWVVYATATYKSNITSPEGLRRLRTYRFLFARFRPERYYFGLVLLVRNLLVASIPVFLVRVPGLQILILTVVLLFGVILQTRYWPWRTEIANNAELGLNMAMTTVSAGVGILLPATSSNLSAMLGWILAVLIIVSLVSAMLVVLKVLHRRLRPTKRFGMFLCHHKAGAGVLCRLLKTLASSNGTVIFLDADHLEELDALFDVVRTSTGSLVVVLSQLVLLRPWCAGEIVTAHRNKVPIVALACEDFHEPGQSEVPGLVEQWTAEQFAPLEAFDISRRMVVEAYSHLLELPRIQISRFQTLEAKRFIFMQLEKGCRQPGSRDMQRSGSTGQTSESKRPEVLIMGAVSEGERLSACELMQFLLQPRLEVETEVLREESEAKALAVTGTVKLIVVLLSHGLLHDVSFARSLMALLRHAHAGGERQPQLLTALSDSAFQFPSADFYGELMRSGLGVPDLGPKEAPLLAETYYSMLTTLSKPFTPLASEATIRSQVAELGNRAAQLLHRPKQPTSAQLVRSRTSVWAEKVSITSGGGGKGAVTGSLCHNASAGAVVEASCPSMDRI